MKQVQQVGNRWSINALDLPKKRFQAYATESLPEEAGSGYSHFFQLEPELNYIKTRYKPSKDLSLLSKIEQQESRLIVTLGLKGASSFKTKRGGGIEFNEGFTTISSFNSSEGERRFEANKEVEQLRLSLTRAGLDRYFGEGNHNHIFGSNEVKCLSFRPISVNSLIAIKQLMKCNVPSECEKLFIHGQVLSILVSELSHLFEQNHATDKFTPKDEELAGEARYILETEFKTPPSVRELSRRVGVNQLKLKQLFHHYFDSTPYATLLEIRMHTAYQMLEHGQTNVSLVADYVGYNYSSNFSTAFIKFFSVSPKQVAQAKHHIVN